MSVKKKPRRNKHRNTLKKHYSQLILLIIIVVSCVWFFYTLFHLQPASDWSEDKANEVSEVRLPKDDAPHQSQIEWWYYNGHLSSESGKQFSFHDTVFLVNSVMNHMISHVSFNDHQTGKHYTDQRKTGGNSSVDTKNRFEFNQSDWLMTGGDGNDRLKVITKDFSFDLQLTSTLSPVFHGSDGIISLAAAGSSYYYSRTRMATSGTITIGDTTEKVTGISWFDHQWGDFSIGRLSWDWFSLQLDNNVDAMIYQLRDKSNNPVLYMASITQNGHTEMLMNTDFTLTPGKKWHSNKTGSDYPLEWRVSIPKKNIDITTNSIISNSEFDARLTTYNHYWEGAIKIHGTHTGRGFMELSGYTTDNPGT
ncbi:MAG: lipocalin family protein [Methylococcales bacterium]